MNKHTSLSSSEAAVDTSGHLFSIVGGPSSIANIDGDKCSFCQWYDDDEDFSCKYPSNWESNCFNDLGY